MRFHHLFAKRVEHWAPLVLPSEWRILLTGVTAIHGWPVYERLKQLLPSGQVFAIRPPKTQFPRGDQVQSLCISDAVGLAAIRDQFRPTHVIVASGVCDLDVCEVRPEWAAMINTEGARAVAQVFGASCQILLMSTDIVFSGNQAPLGGYREDHAPDPVSVAGKTFAAGEVWIKQTPRHCILRLGLPIGSSINGTIGAVDFVENRFKRGLPLTLFHDELRSCITCEEITGITLRLLSRKAEGIFHCGGRVPISLHEMGQSIIARGQYPDWLLSTISRHEEVKGPPRIGNVSLNSAKLVSWLEEQFAIFPKM